MNLETWVAISGMIFTFLGGGGFVALLAYLKHRDSIRAAMVRQERELRDKADDRETSLLDKVRLAAEERQRAADKIVEEYKKSLEDSKRALELRVHRCEEKCDECDRARQEQQIEIDRQRKEIEKLQRTLITSEEKKDVKAVITADAQGIIREWNATATVFFGWLKEEAIGQHISIIIPPMYRPQHETKYDLAFESQIIKDSSWRDFMGMHKDGDDVPVSVKLSLATRGDELFATAEMKKRLLIPAAPNSVH